MVNISNQQKISVTLFLPSKILGGAERQFINIADSLAEEDHINLTVIDSSKGYIVNGIKKENVNKIIIKEKKIKVSNTILLTTANYLFYLNSLIKTENTEVKFLVLSHYNLPFVLLSHFLPQPLSFLTKFIFFNAYKKGVKDFEKSIIFNDLDLKSFYENFFNFTLRSDLMGAKYDITRPEFIDESYLENKVSWIGRLDKPACYFAVERLIKDIASSKDLGENFIFQVIGGGTNIKKLKQIAEECNVSNLVNFEGQVKNENIPKKLNGSKLVFANGTSVYEAVRCNIPVIVFDLLRESDNFCEYQYSFYPERPDEILGKPIFELQKQDKGHTFKSALEVATSNQRNKLINDARERASKVLEKASHSIKNYFSANHEIKPTNQRDFLLDIIFFRFRDLVKNYNEKDSF